MLDFVKAEAGIPQPKVQEMDKYQKLAMEEAVKVAEIIISDGMTKRSGKIEAGRDKKSNDRADHAAVTFKNSIAYKDLGLVRGEDEGLARSLAALITTRELFTEAKNELQKKAHLETMDYIVGSMVDRGWKGTSKAPQWDDCGSIGQMGGGKVSAQQSLAGRGFKFS